MSNATNTIVRIASPHITDADDPRILDAHTRLISAGFMGYHNLSKIHAAGLIEDFLLLERFGIAEHRPARAGRAFGFIRG